MRDLSASSLKTSVRRKMVPSDALSAAVVLVDARLARALAPMAEVMVKAKPSAGKPLESRQPCRILGRTTSFAGVGALRRTRPHAWVGYRTETQRQMKSCGLISSLERRSRTQQPVGDECPANAGLACGVERAHRQAEFAGAPTEQLHGGFYRDWVGGDAEQVAAEREQFAMPFLRLAHPAGVKSANEGFHVTRHKVADHRHHAPCSNTHQRQRQAVVATQDR